MFASFNPKKNSFLAKRQNKVSSLLCGLFGDREQKHGDFTSTNLNSKHTKENEPQRGTEHKQETLRMLG